MRWFQYQRGLVSLSQRIAHCQQQSPEYTLSTGRVRSLCEQEFPYEQLEEVAEPGQEPADHQARPGAPCGTCLLRGITSTGDDEIMASLEASLTNSEAAPRALAVLLREVQWLLDDAAFDLPAGRYKPEQSAHLAHTLEALAKVVREQQETAAVEAG